MATAVLVLYEDSAKARLRAALLHNLLGQGERAIQVRSAASYVAGQAATVDRTFYVGFGWHPARPALADDALAGAAITWIDDRPAAWRFDQVGVALDGVARGKQLTVHYRDQALPGTVRRWPRLAVRSPEVTVHATATLAGETEARPYIVERGRLWLVVGDPFVEVNHQHKAGLYRAFADLLGPMLGDDAEHPARALLRLEDVCAMTDPAALAATLDVLASCAVPFALTVIPRYINAAGADVPWPAATLAQLERATAMGGRIFQHGYTHQFEQLRNPRGESASDWEFWHHQRAARIPGLHVDRMIERVRRGHAALTALSLVPVGWTTPHYGAPADLYGRLPQVLGRALERRRYELGGVRRTQSFPYPVVDLHGAQVLPENLGYVHAGRSPAALLADARVVRAMRRPWASWFLHPYLVGTGEVTGDALRTLLRGIEALGFTFVDPAAPFATLVAPTIAAPERATGPAIGDDDDPQPAVTAAVAAPPLPPTAPISAARDQLTVIDDVAAERFRAIARGHGLDPEHQWVGGFTDFVWQHSRAYFQPSLEWIAGRRVMELGFNYGATSIMLAALGAQVTAIEVDPGYLDIARANAERYGLADRITFLHLSDTRRLPFLDEVFDLVSCNSVLEYVPHGQRRRVLREVDRVLRPGGRVVVCGTSNRLWPREGHSKRWLVNYLPYLVDYALPKRWRPERGVFPWEIRAGLGWSYRRVARPPTPPGLAGALRRLRSHDLWRVSRWIGLTLEKRESARRWLPW